jgi:glucose/arabinose dehydrogenase
MGNNGHPTRTILTSKINPDILLVTRGSNANIDTATTSQSSGRCMIKTFSIKEASASPINFNTGGDLLAWGLRNIVGMGEDPIFGGIVSFFLHLIVVIKNFGQSLTKIYKVVCRKLYG